MFTFMKKHKVQEKQLDLSDLGSIVDYPFVGFQKYIIEQKVPIGVVNNLIILLSQSYTNLVASKDSLIKNIENLDLECKSGAISKKSLRKEKKRMVSCIKDIYKELTKIEQKAIFLRKHSKELLEAGNRQFDTEKK